MVRRRFILLWAAVLVAAVFLAWKGDKVLDRALDMRFGGNVEPDVRVGWRFSDHRRGADTVLAGALDTK